MKKTTVFIFMLLFLAGCLQSTEHLTILKDGSGTLAVDIMVPEATRTLIDSTMGGMMQGMVQGMASMVGGLGKAAGDKMPDLKMPTIPASEEMFGSKEQILKKAKKAGLNIEFLSFDKKVENNNLFVKYTIKYDDVNKLVRSSIMSTKVALNKNDNGDLVLMFKRNKKKADEDKSKMEEFKNQQSQTGTGESGKGDSGDQARAKFEKSMDDFQMRFLVTMPEEITEFSEGYFTKVDPSTVSSEIKGNFMKDPAVYNKMYFIDMQEPHVVCSGQALTFSPDSVASEESESDTSGELEGFSADNKKPAILALNKEGNVSPNSQIGNFSAGDTVQVELNNGNTTEGRFVEKGDDFIRLECEGVPITIFTEEIKAAKKV